MIDHADYDVATIPNGLRPRLLDQVAQRYGHEAMVRSLLHRATHMALGVEASQQFMYLSGEFMKDIREEIVGYAPHPFETYTVSFWIGDAGGTMVECLIMVQTDATGDPLLSGIITLPWDEDEFATGDLFFSNRSETFRRFNDEPTSTITERARASLAFSDTLRLLLAQQGATINKGTASKRASLHKGQRITYYTASAVTIDLDSMGLVRTNVATGYGRAMPNYGYRAHNCHSGGREDCAHFWIEIGGKMIGDRWEPDMENGRANATWECYHCSRRRWHRRAGERGSLNVGEVRQSYRVKKGRGDLVPS